jgi:tetratricopeptide (TPR) repeat protein
MEPAPDEAPAYFRGKCLTCHTNQSCKLPLPARMSKQPANDCVGCHMPKRDIQVISHSTATNHRIVSHPEEPFPDITFHQATSALPDLINLDPAPGNEAAPLPDLTLMQAYGELAAQKPQYVNHYLQLLARLEKSDPNNSMVQAAVGRRELKNGNFDSAAEHLRRAIALAPPQAMACADLADALTHLDRKNEAIVWLDKSIQLDPFNPFTQRTLIVRLIDLKQYARAHAVLEHYVQVFPQDTFMRQMLEKASAQPVQ